MENNYVAGSIPKNSLVGEDQGLDARLESLGYQVNNASDSISIRKPAQIESVLNELVPLCGEADIDPQDLFLVEYLDGKPNAYYQEGRFHR